MEESGEVQIPRGLVSLSGSLVSVWPLSTLGVDGLPGRHSDNFLAQWGVAVLLCSLGQSQLISDVG